MTRLFLSLFGYKSERYIQRIGVHRQQSFDTYIKFNTLPKSKTKNGAFLGFILSPSTFIIQWTFITKAKR